VLSASGCFVKLRDEGERLVLAIVERGPAPPIALFYAATIRERGWLWCRSR